VCVCVCVRACARARARVGFYICIALQICKFFSTQTSRSKRESATRNLGLLNPYGGVLFRRTDIYELLMK